MLVVIITLPTYNVRTVRESRDLVSHPRFPHLPSDALQSPNVTSSTTEPLHHASMGQLSKSTGRLLRRVGSKPHASDEDHEESVTLTAKSNSTARGTSSRASSHMSSEINSRTSSATCLKTISRTSMTSLKEDDIYADPLSSDEEASVTNTAPGRLQFISRQSVASPTQTISTPQWRPARTVSPPQSAGSKRSADAASEHPSSDGDAQIFSSQASQAKRPRTTLSYTSNIHAKPKATWQKPRTVAYGQQAARQRSREEKQQQQKEFEGRRAQKEEKEEKAKGPKFRRLGLGTGARDANRAVFKMPGSGVDCEGGALSDLSDLIDPPSSPPDTQEPETGTRRTECAVCGAMLLAAVREDFEDQHSQARQWSYRWQQRFCKFHKEQEALEQWRVRGYPEIDWDGLAKRMQDRKFKQHLKRVLSGEITSTFRKQFQERVKAGEKSAAQAADSDISGKGVQAGYYGPRGEKLMFVEPCHSAPDYD